MIIEKVIIVNTVNILKSKLRGTSQLKSTRRSQGDCQCRERRRNEWKIDIKEEYDIIKRINVQKAKRYKNIISNWEPTGRQKKADRIMDESVRRWINKRLKISVNSKTSLGIH